MANRRMFSKMIIDTDVFLDMPLSSQALYFHLNMRADDDGFISNSKKIMRMIGASEDDYKILLSKQFIIKFETGVCVVKHWRIHNYIQKDRYTKTIYSDEKKQLSIDDNKIYSKELKQVDTSCIQNDNTLDTQVRLELGKDSIGKSKSNTKKDFFDDVFKKLEVSDSLKETFQDFIQMRKSIKAPMTPRALELSIKKVRKMSDSESTQIEIINQSIMNSWKGIFELKNNQQQKGNFYRADANIQKEDINVRTIIFEDD